MRHTITITVTETWTITWQDGRDTVWEETSTRARPDATEPVLPLRDEKENENGVVDPDAADSVTGAEWGVALPHDLQRSGSYSQAAWAPNGKKWC